MEEKKKSKYNKKRYEENKEHILQYRRERYKEKHQKENDINIKKGYFILHFD